MALNTSGERLPVHGVLDVRIVFTVIERRFWFKFSILRIVFRNVFRKDDRFVRLRRAGFRNLLSIRINGVRRLDAVERVGLVIRNEYGNQAQRKEKANGDSYFHGSTRKT